MPGPDWEPRLSQLFIAVRTHPGCLSYMGKTFIWLIAIELWRHGACISSVLEDPLEDGRWPRRSACWGEKQVQCKPSSQTQWQYDLVWAQEAPKWMRRAADLNMHTEAQMAWWQLLLRLVLSLLWCQAHLSYEMMICPHLLDISKQCMYTSL